MSSFFDRFHGWEEDGNTLETWWILDDAIDYGASDSEAYFLEPIKDHLKVKPLKTPMLIRVDLPGTSQAVELRGLLQSLARTASEAQEDLCHEELVVRAFQLCVRFPEAEAASERPLKMKKVGRRVELPDNFMLALARDPQWGPAIQFFGAWVLNHSLLSDPEKKTSSPESTGKTSEPPDSARQKSTTAQPATTAAEKSSSAQTSDLPQRGAA